MKNQMRPIWLWVLLALCIPNKLLAQSPSYNPFFVSNAQRNTYDPGSGLLRLSSVNMLPGISAPEGIVMNAVLEHLGDNLFQLISVDELTPLEECTRAEVEAAIPLLTLDLTISDAEQLIGCRTHLIQAGVDLQAGRLVYATWTGNDGQPNSSTAFGRTFISADPIRAPSITFAYREGALDSIRYSPSLSTSYCDNENMLEGFLSLKTGDSPMAVNEAVGCIGNLLSVEFNESEKFEDYSWLSQAATYVPTLTSNPVRPPGNESISVSFTNGKLVSSSYNSIQTLGFSDNCSLEELTHAESILEVGQPEAVLDNMLQCGPASISESINADSTMKRLHWQTAFTGNSIFTSPNRRLSIVLKNGEIESVLLSRF